MSENTKTTTSTSHEAADVDPFGIFAAVERARAKPRWHERLMAQGQEFFLQVFALSPLWIWPALTYWAWHSWPSPIPVVLAAVFWAWAVTFFAAQFRLWPVAQTRQPPPPKKSSICVIGAGPVGLAVVKECIALGHDVECFERKDGVGGVYRYTERFHGGVWRSVRFTSSPWVTAFSDFPPESPSSAHWHHSDYVAYLERYVEHFQVGAHLRFHHTVEKVWRAANGGWNVRVRDDAKGEVFERHYQRIALCSGLNLHPKAWKLPGIESFTGTIQHVASYREPSAFVGKKVVVVGMGESGADIAAELAQHTDTTLSIHRGKFIVPRNNPLNGIANDYDTNRMRYATPLFLRDWFMLFKRRLCFRSGHINAWSAVRARLLEVSGAGAMSQTATKNDDFIAPLLERKLKLRKNIVRFEGNEVIYEDGVRAQADAVLFAHGYMPVTPCLELPPHVGKRHPGLLYLSMFHPELDDTLAFCGFARPAIGSIPPCGELQARLFARLAAGLYALPDALQMHVDIARVQREREQIFPTQPQPSVAIEWIPYMDKIAGEIGCRPNVWKLLLRPHLLWKVATGPMTGAIYRIHGPGANPVAVATVRSLPRMHQLTELLTLLGLQLWVWPFSAFDRGPRSRPGIRFL